MNLSRVVTRIKLKLGLAAFATPFPNIDETITEILRDITIPVFSIYQPYKQRIFLDTKDLEKLDQKETFSVYLLPEYFSEKLLYVFDIKYDGSTSYTGYYDYALPVTSGGMVNQIIMSNAASHIADQMQPSLTFNFEKPRTLILYNALRSGRLQLDIGFVHDKSFMTIPDTAEESFMELALLDVKENLYPTLSQYTELNTSIGNITLKNIESWSNAESERKDLLNRWDDSVHLDLYDIWWL